MLHDTKRNAGLHRAELEFVFVASALHVTLQVHIFLREKAAIAVTTAIPTRAARRRARDVGRPHEALVVLAATGLVGCAALAVRVFVRDVVDAHLRGLLPTRLARLWAKVRDQLSARLVREVLHGPRAIVPQLVHNIRAALRKCGAAAQVIYATGSAVRCKHESLLTQQGHPRDKEDTQHER